MNTSKYFYCYSYRLHLFLAAFGIESIQKGINSNTKQKYFKYERNEFLGKILQEWENIKSRVELNEVKNIKN